MRGKIIGVRLNEYKNKDGDKVKRLTLHYTVGSLDVVGLKGDEETLVAGTPIYDQYKEQLEKAEDLIGSEINIEHEVVTMGRDNKVRRLVNLEILSAKAKVGA